MKNKNKKIMLLLCGGTALEERGVKANSVTKPQDIPGWMEQIAEAGIMARLEPVFLAGGGAELNGVKLWQKICQTIKAKYNQADGFIVILEPAAALSCGIALSFALGNLSKPVVLTGSQITEETIKLPEWSGKRARAYGGLGVKANLINAIQLVNLELKAVALMFGNRIVSPTKAKRIQTVGLNLFDSVDETYLAKIDFGISLTEKPSFVAKSLVIKDQFEENIQIINWLPGSDLAKIINKQAKGIIIRDLPSLDYLVLNSGSVPFLIYSRFLVNQKSPAKNVIIAGPITWEAAVIKFMWALAQSDDVGKIMNQEQSAAFVKRQAL